jgi:transglutaminase-like putative cysteine protease
MSFFSSSQDKYQALNIDESLIENANAVIRSHQMTIDINGMKEMIVSQRKVVTVLNKSGNIHATAFVGYDEGRKIKDIYLLVYDKFGNQIEKFKKKDFKDTSAVDGSTLYSDSKVKYYPFTPIEYPYTVEFYYQTITSNTGELPPAWAFSQDFMVSTQKSELTINYSQESLKPVIKEKNFGAFEILNKSTENSIVYQANNIKALKKERYSPSIGKIVPLVLIRPVNFNYEGYDASINSWSDLGLWMHKNLISGRDDLSASTINVIKGLVKDVDDDLEKAKIVFQYVQDNTRYISVQVGIGGIQPISAVEVDRLKYGDCKGLSNYTKALLKAVGVESYYVHVEAGNEKISFEDDFPNLAQGNHVILAIPYNDKYYWVDATSQIVPFGFIGNFTDDRKVLVIKPEGGEIVTTVSYINDQNYQKTEAEYQLNDEGAIQGHVTRRSQGVQYDDKYYLEKESEENIKKFYKNYWDNINNLEIKKYGFLNEQDQVEFTENIGIKARNYASKSGIRLLFSPNVFNRIKRAPPRYKDRKLPFEIQRGFLDEDEYTISLPKGYSVESIPNAVSIDTKYGVYEMKLNEVSSGRIKLTRKLSINQGNYPKEDYSDYRNFLKEIAKSDATKIVIKPNS